MANSLYKILCPKHEEETPSCTVYDDGSGFCFGCNTYFAKLDEPAPVKIEPEDLSATFAYIKTLPIIDHRGLQFPYDNTGYYITWPNDAYYKKRKWETIESGPKYKGAKGITKPWFNYNEGSSSPICVIVEGEVNAMSLHKACPDLPIYCPGGASNFTDSQAKRLLPILQMYAQIEIVVDEDIPGVTAAIALKSLLQPACTHVCIHLMEEDVNSILVKHGIEGVKNQIKITESI